MWAIRHTVVSVRRFADVAECTGLHAGASQRQHPTATDLRRRNRNKSKVRAMVEHCFYIKRLFGLSQVRYRGIAKNLNRLQVTCALVNFVWRSKVAVASDHIQRFPSSAF